MRICVFSERMAPPFDEGIRNLVLHLARELANQHDVMLLTTLGQSVPSLNLVNVGGACAKGVCNVPLHAGSDPVGPASTRGSTLRSLASGTPDRSLSSALRRIPAALLLSRGLLRRMRAFAPELILYIPTASATLFSTLRSRVLRMAGKGVPVVMLALQPRPNNALARMLMPWLRPELVLVQAESTRVSLAALGFRVRCAPPAIDLERFRPVSAERRSELRHEFAIDDQAFVIVHVGHINRRRNIQSLMALQRPGTQVVVVGSTSTPHDESLIAELARAGVRVITQFLPEVAEIYQMADCYVFPVEAASGAIDLPLSVLEAMACDLPVVSTRFGGLPAYLAESDGLRYVDSAQEIGAAIEALRSPSLRLMYRVPGATRALVEPFAWPVSASSMLALACREVGLADAAQRGDDHGR